MNSMENDAYLGNDGNTDENHDKLRHMMINDGNI